MVTTMDSLTVQIGADVKPFEASLGRISSDFDGLDSKLSALSNKIDGAVLDNAGYLGWRNEVKGLSPNGKAARQATGVFRRGNDGSHGG